MGVVVRREVLAHGMSAIAGLASLLALVFVFDQAWEHVYAWLGVAMAACEFTRCDYPFVTLTDRDELPEPDQVGIINRPSVVVSFLASAFVPTIALLHAGFLDGAMGVVVAALVILSALYRLAFMQQPEDGPPWFNGFPTVWGLVGFHLHAFDATPLAAVLFIGAGVVMSLLPLNWFDPLRTPRWKPVSIAVIAIWCVTAMWVLWSGFPATPATKGIFIAVAAYALLQSILLNRRTSTQV